MDNLEAPLAAPAATPDRMVTTYSMWSMFRDCREKARLRYVEEIAPIQRDAAALRFGDATHGCLEKWHAGLFDDTVPRSFALQAHIDGLFPNRSFDAEERADWHLLSAMMRGYIRRYPRAVEPFRVLMVEAKFQDEIINPETGQPSRTFTIAGKVDGILEMKADAAVAVMEHKTAALIDGAYLEKLWCDTQIMLYSFYVGRALERPVTQVVYNVLAKARLRQKAGWTEEEYAEKLAEAQAKNKSGKSSLKRQLPETDEEFAARLDEWYAQPGAFHRETILVDQQALSEVQSDLWEMTKSWLAAKARPNGKGFIRNRNHCFHWGRPCPYWPLCSSYGNPNIRDNMYEFRPAHTELGVDAEPTETLPF